MLSKAIETGAAGQPSWTFVLADALDVSTDTLLGRAQLGGWVDQIFLRGSTADARTVATVKRITAALRGLARPLNCQALLIEGHYTKLCGPLLPKRSRAAHMSGESQPFTRAFSARRRTSVQQSAQKSDLDRQNVNDATSNVDGTQLRVQLHRPFPATSALGLYNAFLHLLDRF